MLYNFNRFSQISQDKPFLSLSPTDKASILAFLCNELLQNKAVIRQIEGSLETVAHLRKERWLLDTKIRKLRMVHNRKVRSEAAEKAQAKTAETGGETQGELATIDSPSLNLPHHKDDLLDEEEEAMSDSESVGTQPEEEEDNKLSGEELGKKLEKLLKTSETQLHSLNLSAHQLRATCYGQDRFWRRYWSLPTAGGIFVEAMESAQPEVLEEQKDADCCISTDLVGIKSIEDIKRVIHGVEGVGDDKEADKEVSKIVGGECEDGDDEEHGIVENGVVEEHEQVAALDGDVEKDKDKMDVDEKVCFMFHLFCFVLFCCCFSIKL